MNTAPDPSHLRDLMKHKARLRLERILRMSKDGKAFPASKERMIAVCTMKTLCDHSNVYLLGSERDEHDYVLSHTYRCDDCNMQIDIEVAF